MYEDEEWSDFLRNCIGMSPSSGSKSIKVCELYMVAQLISPDSDLHAHN